MSRRRAKKLSVQVVCGRCVAALFLTLAHVEISQMVAAPLHVRGSVSAMVQQNQTFRRLLLVIVWKFLANRRKERLQLASAQVGVLSMKGRGKRHWRMRGCLLVIGRR